MRLLDEGVPFQVERLALLEDNEDVDLPPAVVRHLRERNAARPAARCFPDGANERVIDRFLGLVPPDHALYAYDIAVVMTQLDERILFDLDHPFPPLVPLAALEGGDFVCADLRLDPDGEAVAHEGSAPVVVWDHEASDDLAPAIHRIAPDWDAFLTMLTD